MKLNLENNYLKLGISLIVDAIGSITYFAPGIGEIFDLIWAPISAAIVYRLYGSTSFTSINFIEEILPGTDFIPTATISWIIKK